MRPGVTTDALDAVAHEACIARGGYPSPLNYHGFPKSLCTSVNEVICHGIPDDRALVDGDIVNLDVTVYLDGVHGDTNATFLVGDGRRRLAASWSTVTRECLGWGIEAVRPGPSGLRHRRRPSRPTPRPTASASCATSSAMASARSSTPCSTIPHYSDPTADHHHGAGHDLHHRAHDHAWAPGATCLWDDGWTAVTADRRRTAQFEHTLLVTDDGAEILTVIGS